jgi:hypothetical protein
VAKALYDAVKGNRYLNNLMHLAVACGLSLHIAAAYYWASSQPLLQASQENLPISSIFREIDKLPGDALIFSNCFDCVYFWGGHISREIPFWLNPYTLEQRDTEGQFEQNGRELTENHGYLVWVDDVHRNHLVSEAELVARLPVRLKVRASNGSIYEVDDLAFQSAPEGNEQAGNQTR